MKIELTFIQSQDEAGYSTYRAVPSKNPLCRNAFFGLMQIIEWTPCGGGVRSRFGVGSDRLQKARIWSHTGCIKDFSSYEDCEKSLTAHVDKWVNEIFA